MSDNGDQKLRAYLERATNALRRTKQQLAEVEARSSEPIAIVGMACRFPGGVKTPEQLWQLLDEGRDAITPFPRDRGWRLEHLYDPDPANPGTTYARGGGFLDHPGLFDPSFFNISPREAASIDPQQRLLLEASWEALERAGIVPASLYESATGVFVGVCYNDYLSVVPGPAVVEDGYATLGNLYSVSSGRIAYTLGLQGPAVSIDTACSTSLVAIHLAVQALRKGECELALAGGATTFSTPEPLISFARLRTLSPDGRCKAFSADADGAGWSEGVGMLVLERLSDAQRKGHQILGLVRGSAVNQDGRSQGLTAPNGPSQQRVIRAALSDARLTAAEVDVVEAHGTGTSLGDPIEAHALMATYGREHDPARPLWLGSIKSNLGHTQAAAGIAGLMKLLLSMQHGRLPRTLHAEEPSPRIDWSAGTVKLLRESRPWSSESPRRGAVSSFGISGTNAHVIVEEPPAREQASPVSFAPTQLLTVSGNEPAALEDQARHLHTHVLAHPELSMGQLAGALARTRTHFSYRAVLACRSREQALEGLDALAERAAHPALVAGTRADAPMLAVMFTGQGSQRAGMGRELYAEQPVFRDAFDQICECFDKRLEHPLAKIVFAEPGSELAAKLDQTRYTQPALFALEVALYRLYESWGLVPDVLMGHSIGELVAAHIAGVLSLQHAYLLVETRARLMQALPGGGAMISIAASEAEVRESIEQSGAHVDIAGINGPLSTVISGDEEPALAIAAYFQQRERKTRRLSVSHAFHSSRMQPMLDSFRRIASKLEFNPPQIPIISNLTGEVARAEDIGSADYWVRHVAQSVRFLDGVQTLENMGVTMMLELGPRAVLCGMASACLSEDGSERIELNPSLGRDEPEHAALARSLGRLHCHGIELDWSAVLGEPPKTFVELPTYPFQRQSYWNEQGPSSVNLDALGLKSAEHQLLGFEFELADSGSAVLTGQLSLSPQAWIGDHVIFGKILLPGTAFVELALAAGQRVGAELVDELELRSSLELHEGAEVSLQISVGRADEQGRRSLAIHSRPTDSEGDFSLHATGTLRLPSAASSEGLGAWPPAGELIDLRDAYERFADSGYDFGPVFRGLERAWKSGDDYYVEVELPPGAQTEGFGIHPALLDAATHILALDWLQDGVAKLPFSWSGMRLHANGANTLRARLRPHPHSEHLVSLRAVDANDELVIEGESLAFRPVSAADLRRSSARAEELMRTSWLETPLDDEPVGSMVVLGARPLPGLGASAQPTIDELLTAVRAGATAPDTILADFSEPEQQLDALAHCVRALTLLQRWQAAPELGDSTLVFVSSGAVATHADEPLKSVAAAGIWGLVRAAQHEIGERLRIVDVGTQSWALLTRALASKRPQLALRSREGDPLALAPHLVRVNNSLSTQALDWDPKGTVLITGGTGALGALVARHLAETQPLGRLLLCSRRGEAAPGASELRQQLEDAGVEVSFAACDVSDRGALAALIDALPAASPLTAVIHTAGVLEDGTLASLDHDKFARVFRPKLDAARHLDELTRDHPLAAFVLFSSIVSVIGNAGQANYAAANACIDALAHQRRCEGLPATSLGWGPWAEGGMAARLSAAERARLGRKGLVPISQQAGLAMLELALRGAEAVVVAAKLNTRVLEGGRGPLPLPFRVAHKRAATSHEKQPKSEGGAGLARRLAQTPADEREDLLIELVREQASAVLDTSADRIDAARPLHDHGLDSLMAVELRGRLQKATGLRLPATLLFDYPKIKGIAKMLRAEFDLDAAPQPSAPQLPAQPAHEHDEEPIVIVAMACRYPGGVHSPEQLWRLIETGRDASSGFPDDRGWSLDKLFDPDPAHAGTSISRRGGFLHEAADFDASFFGISAREAMSIDPQQRLLLETSWEALERAGIPAQSLNGTPTGVFVGIMYSDYGSRLYASPEALEGYVAIGSAPSVASGRIAYTLGLEGPALTVDTACSSSLVALHLAARALRNRECDLALAGGATVMATPTVFIEFSRQRGLAADGRCKAYSDLADGVGWSEGAGMLVLERMSDAKRNGHPILAIVRGSAINQDGLSQGLTAPNGPSQQRVIRSALADAGLRPDEIDLVEGHGTGTRLGDPIEVQALQSTYGRAREQQPLWLGSVKSNIGHTQAAAGVAGIIKVLLAMKHGLLPRSLHADQPSTKVEWGEGVQLLAEARPWSSQAPRRAAVSSFGISGTNAHVILEQVVEPPPPAPALTRARHVPLILSGKNAKAIQMLAAQLSSSLPSSLPDLAYSLLTTRTHHEQRALVVADTLEHGRASLEELAAGRVETVTARAAPKLALLFTGQGAQRLGMGRELAAAVPSFRAQLEAIASCFADELEHPLLELMFSEQDGELAGLLDQTAYTQPALFALEVALFRLLEERGVKPSILLGHSVGELAAAHVAGVFSLRDACRLVAARARLMQALPAGGAMAAIQASEAELAAALAEHPGVDVAGLNGPRSTVISGDEQPVLAIVEQFERKGRKTRQLKVSHAFHSHRMDAMLDEFRTCAASIQYAPAQLQLVSNVSGKLAQADELSNPEYWVRHVRQPVRFLDGVRVLDEQGVGVALELGPHGVLSAMAADCLSPQRQTTLTLLPTLRRGRDELEAISFALGSLFCHGLEIDWESHFSADRPRRVELPTYPFQRRRFWLDVPKPSTAKLADVGLDPFAHPILGAVVKRADEDAYIFTGELSLESQPWLAEHRVFAHPVVPGTALLEFIQKAADHIGGARIEELTLNSPLGIPADESVQLQVSVSPELQGRREVRIFSRVGDSPAQLHAQGNLVAGHDEPEFDASSWPPADATAVDLSELHTKLASHGLEYGEAFQGLHRAWTHGTDHYLEAQLPPGLSPAGFVLHPALFDACLHLLGLEGSSAQQVAVPFSWSELRWRSSESSAIRVRIRARASEGFALDIASAQGAPICSVAALTPRPVSRVELRRALAERDKLSLYELVWQELDHSPQGAATWQLQGASPSLRTALGHAGLELTGDDAATSSSGAAVTCLCAEGSEPGEITVGLLEALQRWLLDEQAADTKLVVLTQGALAAAPDEEVESLAQAPLWGLVRSAQTEHPDRSIVLIDVDDAPGSLAKLDAALGSGETQLAIREAKLLIPRLARAGRGSGAVVFPSDRIVLVTGGTGGIGAALARHLVEHHGVQHLLLVSRSGPRAQGARSLESELTELGARVDIRACDVSNKDALAQLLGSLDAPLGAIVHAAGVLDDAMFGSQTAGSVRKVFGPKVDAATHLHELSLDMQLSAFVLLSSISGLIGGGGQANYAAANTYLDALAAQRRARGLPGTSIAYGPWATGMAARLASSDLERLERQGFVALSDEQGLELFDRAVAGEAALVAAAQLDLRAIASSSPPPILTKLAPAPASRAVLAEERPPAPLRELLLREPDQALPRLTELVVRELCAVLREEQIEPDVDFFALGVDSLMALELRTRLQRQTGMSVPAGLLFQHRTAQALSQELYARVRDLGESTKDDEREIQAWLADAQLGDHLEYPDLAPAQRAQSILITGGNGFLGSHVLHELIGQAPDAKLHVLIRAEHQAHARQRLSEALESWQIATREQLLGRVTLHVGDIAKPQLGLTDEDWRDLADELDLIIANGAVVDWLKPYEELRPTNVLGALHQLELAATGRPKRVLYVSSVVAAEVEEGRILETTGHPRPMNEMGYSWSKFIGERLAARAQERGLDLVIIRPAAISASSVTGLSNMAQIESRFLGACVEMAAVPSTPIPIDFTPVDVVASMLVEAALSPGTRGELLHLAQLSPYSPHWLVEVIRSLGWQCEVSSQAEWNARLEAQISAGKRQYIPLRSYSSVLEEAAVFDTSTTRERLSSSSSLPNPTEVMVLALKTAVARAEFVPRPR